MEDTATAILRRHLLPWGFALLLPMPVLLGAADSGVVTIAVVYLAVGAALLAGEIFRPRGIPEPRSGRRAKFVALTLASGINVVVFALLGLSAGVPSNLPLPLLAALSVLPAIGLVPWLTLRWGQPYVALVLAGCAALLVKLAACVVARIAYGPDFIELGYVADDWRTAKLMISLFWSGVVALSLAGFVATARSATQRDEPKAF